MRGEQPHGNLHHRWFSFLQYKAVLHMWAGIYIMQNTMVGGDGARGRGRMATGLKRKVRGKMERGKEKRRKRWKCTIYTPAHGKKGNSIATIMEQLDPDPIYIYI